LDMCQMESFKKREKTRNIRAKSGGLSRGAKKRDYTTR
jgi:hypothetical protein